MYLMRLIYCSKVTSRFKTDDIDQILEKSRKRNKDENITGVLCFNRKYFLQCIEGSREAINNAYHRILQDPRHDHIILLGYTQIPHREFTTWQMAFIPEKKITDEINLKYSNNRDFDPFTMNGESTYQMLVELSNNVTAI
jgi:hypothetical protein